jgi:hypothetical protein
MVRTVTIFEEWSRWEEGHDEPTVDRGDEKMTTFESESTDDIADFLRGRGLTEFSAYPDWQPRGWYLNPDGSWHDWHSGLDVRESAHLAGFTHAESQAIYTSVTGRTP